VKNHLLRAGALGVAIASLIGCSDAGQTVTVATGATAPVVAPEASAAFLKASSDRTAAVPSGRYSMAFSMTNVPQLGSVTFTASGAFDTVNQRALMSMDFGALMKAAAAQGGADAVGIAALLGDGQFEIITDGTKAYIRFGLLKLLKPDLTKTWVVADASSLGVDRTKLMSQFGGGAGSLDQQTLVQLLKAVGADVREVGKDDVMGTSTTHYTASLALADFLAAAPAAEAAKLRDQLGALGANAGDVKIPTDVWVDDHGVVRRLTMTIAGFEASAPAATMKIDMTLYDVGQPITIELPPASDVQSVAS